MRATSPQPRSIRVLMIRWICGSVGEVDASPANEFLHGRVKESGDRDVQAFCVGNDQNVVLFAQTLSHELGRSTVFAMSPVAAATARSVSHGTERQRKSRAPA